ncbi:hypothetical protein CDAR_10421 [Caerostris darwini]|uniref:Uncharacterized protein n=1 Tax=Caerostris darwini TaxID=1538125 RepID=A0AAV4RX70_9ARAC|nr:hypothetical protein CDAR_10421 [Caerostris darwini]
MKSYVSFALLFNIAHTPQRQTTPTAKITGSSDLLTPVLLLKEVQCIMDAFSEFTEAVKQMHQAQNSIDKFGILMIALPSKDFPIGNPSVDLREAEPVVRNWFHNWLTKER